MPNASVGAPPVRETIDSSPTLSAASVISPAVIGAPGQPEPVDVVGSGLARCRRSGPAGAFIAKYRCWSRIAAVISAMIATNDSVSMPP